MEYGNRVLIISKLAAVPLSELRFGRFGHLKVDTQSCLAQFNHQKFVNLQSIKNRIIEWVSAATLRTLQM